MAQSVDRAYQVLASELSQRALDATFMADFPVEGRFVPVTVKDRKYWYFDLPAEGGGKTRRYVGPAGDEEISRRVEAFRDLKADANARRKLVSTLVREARLPQPDTMTGEVVKALADAGFFRLRGVLVGTIAFQTYSLLLGIRLPEAALQTGDADFAQFHSVAAAVEDSLPPILDVLRSVDATFRAVPHLTDPVASTRFVTRSGFNVEFLTPNTGSEDHAERAGAMPSLGGASAQPLRFLDFLIHEPVRSVLLHRFGVPVLVPAPERFAVHKLIVAARRRTEGDSALKAGKDLRQSFLLADALGDLRRHADLAEAWADAWRRGPAWRSALARGLSAQADAERERISDVIRSGIEELGLDPAGHGLSA